MRGCFNFLQLGQPEIKKLKKSVTLSHSNSTKRQQQALSDKIECSLTNCNLKANYNSFAVWFFCENEVIEILKCNIFFLQISVVVLVMMQLAVNIYDGRLWIRMPTYMYMYSDKKKLKFSILFNFSISFDFKMGWRLYRCQIHVIWRWN